MKVNAAKLEASENAIETFKKDNAKIEKKIEGRDVRIYIT